MPAPAGFIALSKTNVLDNVITYFANKHGRPRSYFQLDTDIKARFGYRDNDWANVAPGLSAEPWMLRIQVRIARPEMAGNTTVGQLTNLIWGKVPKLIATTLDDFSLAPKKAKAKKKGKAKSTKAKKAKRKKRATR